MIVTNNTLLNILIPNDNKALKEVLKQADAQQLGTQSKSGSSVQDVIKNLFNDSINGTKTNETILNLLKNSGAFKEMGNFTNELKNLQTMIKNNPQLQKFEAVIKNFLVNINSMDNNVLKEQLDKSGVFLESKLNDTLKTNNLPNKIQNILVQLKAELSNINTPQAKDISNFIDKMLSTKTHTQGSLTKDLNNLLNNIKNLPDLKNEPQVQNLVNLTTQLKAMSNEIQLLDNKIPNNSSSQTTQTKSANNTAITQTLEQKNMPQTQIKELLSSIKEQLSKVDMPKAAQLSQEINNITSQKNVPMQNILNQTKSLVSQLQNFIVNQPTSEVFNKMSQLTNSLKTLSYTIKPTNEQVSLSTSSVAENKMTSMPKINELLNSIKQALSTSDLPKSNQLLQEVNNLLSQKNIPDQTILNQTKTIVSQLQNFLTNQPTSNLTNNLSQLTNSLKTLAYEPVQTQNTQNPQPIQTQNTSGQTDVISKFNDILSNIKSELLNNNSPLTKNALQIIDKLLSQPNLMQNQQSFQSSINELLTTIKTIITNMPNQSNIQPAEIYRLINSLENSIRPDSALISEKALKLNPELQKSNLTHDMKSILLKLGDEIQQQTNTPQLAETLKQVDKLLTQIDYHQLMSLTSSSNHVYLPFIWDMLEDGSLSMKKLDEEKFYVEINLKLKEFGKINLLLVMYDKNHLDISIFAQKQMLKDEVSEHLQGLKKSLNSVGIIPGTIKLLDLKEENEKKEEETVYNNSNDQQIGFGVNIKV